VRGGPDIRIAANIILFCTSSCKTNQPPAAAGLAVCEERQSGCVTPGLYRHCEVSTHSLLGIFIALKGPEILATGKRSAARGIKQTET
jgi:hypothetical protein